MQIQFAAQAYTAASTPLIAQRCVNFYVERSPPDAESLVPIFGHPGVDPLYTLGDEPVLAVHKMGVLAFIATVASLYYVQSGGGLVRVGSIGLAQRPSIADNGSQLVLVDGVSGFVAQLGGVPFPTQANADAGSSSVTLRWVPSNMLAGDACTLKLDDGTTFSSTIKAVDSLTGVVTLNGTLPSAAAAGALFTDTAVQVAQILDPGFIPARCVAYFDTYFVFTGLGDNEYFLSGQLDGTTYLTTDRASLESDSSLGLAVAVLREMLVFLKAGPTSEVWYDAGSLDFPFQRFDGAQIQRGIAGPLAFVVEDNTLFFLGDDGVFYRMNGFTPERVSTHATEAAWQTYTTLSDTYCFSFSFDGHKFVVVQFPSGGATFIFDVATRLWHERDSYNPTAETWFAWRVVGVVRLDNVLLAADGWGDGAGVLDANTFTEWGAMIRALVTSPPIHDDRQRIFHSKFELLVESGVGLASGTYTDPQVVLDWSDDGGRTFSSRQISRSLGKAGAYRQRVRWLRLGQSRTRIYRMQITDPVRRNILGVYLNEQKGVGV